MAIQVKGRRPTEEEIRIRAYELFLDRGGQPGQETEDWLRAERDLTDLYNQPGATVALPKLDKKEAAGKR
jgi:hypothetical protein